MTTDQGDFNRPDNTRPRQPAGSLFRQLTPAGDRNWHEPPRPKPVDAYAATTPTIAIPADHGAPQADAAPKGSRFRFAAIFGLVGGIFLLTAVAGGAYFAYQALLGHEDRVTAEYAPANSWAYLAINVDPTSHAWLDAWQLAKSAGLDDELSRLPAEGLEGSGEDPAIWETLIKPAIGRETGFAIWPNTEGVDADPNFAYVVMIADMEKAREAIDVLLDDEPTELVIYRDVQFHTSDDGSAIGIIDEALVVTLSEDAFTEIVDARRDGALDGDAEFNSAAERSAENPLVFAYVNGNAIAEAIDAVQGVLPVGPGMMPVYPANLGGSLDFYREFGQITLTIKADGNALRTEVLTDGRPATFPMASAGDAFTDLMPASTLFYVASADLYGSAFQPALDQYDTMLDQAAGDGSMMLPTAGDVEMLLGFDPESDLLAQMTGPWALSLNAELTDGQYGGQFHFFSELADGATVEDALETLVADFGMLAPIEPIDGGYRVEIPEQQVVMDLTVIDNVLHLSGGYRASEATGSLSDDPAFKTAMNGMPDNPTLAGYVATNQLWSLLPAEAWSDMTDDDRAALEAFGPLAFATAPDGDGTRTLFVMTVGE